MEFFNKPNFVSHYTTQEAALNILSSGKLRFSSLAKVNDPREYANDWIDVSPECQNMTQFLDNDYDRECNLKKDKIKDKLYNRIRLLCTTSFVSVNNGQEGNIICKPRMWAQYAQNSQGVCLIFDKEKLHAIIEKLDKIASLSGEVEYLPYIGEIGGAHLDIQKDMIEECLKNDLFLWGLINKNRFLRKHSDWESENEYRWLMYSKEENDTFVDCMDALVGVVLGIKASNADLNTFSSLLQSRNKDASIVFGRLHFSNGGYGLCRLQ